MVMSDSCDDRQGLRSAPWAKREARPVEKIAKGVVMAEGGGEGAVVVDQWAQDAPRTYHPSMGDLNSDNREKPRTKHTAPVCDTGHKVKWWK